MSQRKMFNILIHTWH